MQIKKYLEFVSLYAENRAPFPCSSERVALFASWLARTMKYGSIINYLSGLNFFLKQGGFRAVQYQDFLVAATLRGIRRKKGDAPRRAPPLLPAQLLQIFGGLTLSEGHTAWRAAVLCSFRALLRKCQVTESESALLRRDFKFYDWGMILYVRRTKTIQFQERVLEVPVARCHKKELCAVHWAEVHFGQTPAGPDQLAFRLPSGGGRSAPLTYKLYQEMLKLFANKAGLGHVDFTSHSLRRGGCTYLSMAGASIEEIKVRGDWASDTVYRYLKTPLQQRILNDIQVAVSLASVEERVEELVGSGVA